MSDLRWPQPPEDVAGESASGAAAAVASEDATGAAKRARYSRREKLLAALVLLGLLLAGGMTFLAVSNKSQADRWETRASRLQRNADALNTLLVRRTAVLNARVRQLNVMGAKVTQATTALRRSEGDVQSLEVRQRQLADEKAQLEDQRTQLEQEQGDLTQVASNYITCKRDLTSAIQAVANQDYSWLDAYGQAVQDECSNADSSLQDFVSTYGG
jgi:hypothetical protein